MLPSWNGPLPLSHSHCLFICILRFLPIMGHHTGVRVLHESLSLHLLFILVCFYYSMLGAGVKRLLMLFSEGIVPYVAVYLLCPWDNVNSGSSHATILYCLQILAMLKKRKVIFFYKFILFYEVHAFLE